MKVVGIVQARMGSQRLPGKVLKEVKGTPLLAYQLRRLQRATQLDQLVVATSVHPSNEKIVDLCHAEGVAVFRGSEQDVLARYYEVAQRCHADVVVRLTADCPLIDPQLVDQVVAAFRAESRNYDYYSNTLERAFPPGMDVEVIPFAALERAHCEAVAPDEREHVTLYLYQHPDQFRLGSFTYRLTVDTAEDFETLSRMINDLDPTATQPTFAEQIAWLQQNQQ